MAVAAVNGETDDYYWQNLQAFQMEHARALAEHRRKNDDAALQLLRMRARSNYYIQKNSRQSNQEHVVNPYGRSIQRWRTLPTYSAPTAAAGASPFSQQRDSSWHQATMHGYQRHVGYPEAYSYREADSHRDEHSHENVPSPHTKVWIGI